MDDTQTHQLLGIVRSGIAQRPIAVESRESSVRFTDGIVEIELDRERYAAVIAALWAKPYNWRLAPAL